MPGTRPDQAVDDERAGSPAWWAGRQDWAESAGRVPLTLSGIAAGALRLIDRDGLGTLSMRNLATELQTGTTTLYRYVSSKDEVLALVADAVLSEAQLRHPAEGRGWRETLEELARSMRAMLNSHPHVATLFATAVPVGPNSLRAKELTLGILCENGFDATLASDVYTALAHQVLASVLQEPMDDFRTGGLGTAKSLTLRDFYRSLPAEQYPHLVGLADELTSRTAEEEFEFGLECLLDGVASRLRQSRTQRRGSQNTS